MSEIDTPAEYEPDDDMDLGWQPIETAPNDGTHVLVCGRCTFEAYQWKGEWFLADASELDFEPTHWMPLSKPPDAMKALVAIAARLVRGSDLVDLMELAEHASDRVSRRQLDRLLDDAADRLKVVGIELKRLADQVKP